MTVPIKFIGESIEGSSEPRTWDILAEAVPRKGENVMFDDLNGHRVYSVREISHWYLWKPREARFGHMVEVQLDLLRAHEDSSVRVVESH